MHGYLSGLIHGSDHFGEHANFKNYMKKPVSSFLLKNDTIGSKHILQHTKIYRMLYKEVAKFIHRNQLSSSLPTTLMYQVAFREVLVPNYQPQIWHFARPRRFHSYQLSNLSESKMNQPIPFNIIY